MKITKKIVFYKFYRMINQALKPVSYTESKLCKSLTVYSGIVSLSALIACNAMNWPSAVYKRDFPYYTKLKTSFLCCFVVKGKLI